MKKSVPIIMIVIMTITMIDLNSYEEDPRIAEHNRLTDYLLHLGDEQAEAKERERMALLAQDRFDDDIIDDDDEDL